MTTNNEAAERLHQIAEWHECEHGPAFFVLIDDAEAVADAERKATVERIRAALEGLGGWRDPRYSGMFESKGLIGRADALAILDAASGDWDAEAIVREITEASR